MRFKILRYNKYRCSIDVFERELQAFVESAPEITGMRVTEHSNSDLVFFLELGGPKTVEQSAAILAWLGDEAESVVNSALEAAESNGKQIKYVNFLALNKSPRILAAMIVEHGSETVDSGQDEQQRKAEVQDPRVDAKPKRRAKRAGV